MNPCALTLGYGQLDSSSHDRWQHRRCGRATYESTMRRSKPLSRWSRATSSGSGTMASTRSSRSFPCLPRGLEPRWLAKHTLTTRRPALGSMEEYRFEIPDQDDQQRRSGASWRSYAGKSGRNTPGASGLPQVPRTRMSNADALQTPMGGDVRYPSLLAPRRSRQSMSLVPHLHRSHERRRQGLL